MGPSISHCTTTVYGFGDNTAGPIWKYSLQQPQSPLGGMEHATNYPFGESIYSPVGYSLILQNDLLWSASHIAGPICGYNIVNVIGFMSSALVMFGFIYALTNKRWIALISGYAVTFSPYFQMKVGGHPSYGYQALLIGLAWAFLRLLKHQRRRDSVYVSILIAVNFYFDPYFSLLASLVIIPMVIVWALLHYPGLVSPRNPKGREQNPELFRQLKLIGATILLTAVLLVPLASVYAFKGQQINTTVAAARGNVLAEAKACSNWPHEYLLPFVLSPIFTHLFGTTRYENTITYLHDNFSCGIGEDTVGLSLTLLFVTALGFVIMCWEKINRRRLNLSQLLNFDTKLVLWGVVAVGFAAALIGFPPLHFHHIPTPSALLLSITTTWRTLTRVYVVVNIALVVLAAVVLTYFSSLTLFSRRVLAVLLAVIFLGVAVEYQAFMPFSGNKLSTFNYQKDAPAAYYWLGQQQPIKVVAEYPLEIEGQESNAGSYYLSMQTIDHKKLFNSALSDSPQEVLRSGLKNLADPQTVPVLASMGVNAVIVHGLTAAQVSAIPYLKVIYYEKHTAFNLLAYTPTVKTSSLVVAQIVDAPKVNNVIELHSGFPRNTTIINSAIAWQYEAIDNSQITIAQLAGNSSKPQPTDVCFEAKMADIGDRDQITLITDGQPQTPITLTDQYRELRTQARQSVVIHDAHGHNMRLTALGCPAAQ